MSEDGWQEAAGPVVRSPAKEPAREEGDRLRFVVETVREISRQTDPQQMVSLFRQRAMRLHSGDGSLSLSRRGLQAPEYRITRSTRWRENINPWRQPDRLPLLSGGLLAELLYANEPKVLHDVTVSADDPAFEYLQHARSLLCLPLYDGDMALNMVVRLSSDPGGFRGLNLADAVLESNLFGMATRSLVIAEDLRAAHGELDHEMKRVAEIQRSLLPPQLPDIPGVDVATSYKTAARAGGDYYDFFQIDDGRWGVLIADVSGHGTPAAVVMAMLRTMLHSTQCHDRGEPAALLRFANQQLCVQSDQYDGTFVTAFYGVLDPVKRTMEYACAGHNPPLLVDRHIHVRELDEAQSLPLAVEMETEYKQAAVQLAKGDTLLLYTDGITEAADDSGTMYGRDRLLSCVREDVPNAQHIIDCVVHKLIAFTGGKAAVDDQTLLALRIR